MVVPPGGGLRTHTHTNVEATRRTGPFSLVYCAGAICVRWWWGLVGCGGEEKCVIEEGGICDGEASVCSGAGGGQKGKSHAKRPKAILGGRLKWGGGPNWIEGGGRERRRCVEESGRRKGKVFMSEERKDR